MKSLRFIGGPFSTDPNTGQTHHDAVIAYLRQKYGDTAVGSIEDHLPTWSDIRRAGTPRTFSLDSAEHISELITARVMAQRPN